MDGGGLSTKKSSWKKKRRENPPSNHTYGKNRRLLSRYSTARGSVLQLVRASQAEQKRRKNVPAKAATKSRRVEIEGGVVCRENE